MTGHQEAEGGSQERMKRQMESVPKKT